MDCKYLMIGDWVSCHKVLDKINYIEDFKGNYNISCYGMPVSKGIEEFDPIPLTEHILKVNGWNYVEENFHFYWNGLGLPDLEQITKGQYGFGICTIKYVHELQHALRLCGLNDLADNLQIK